MWFLMSLPLREKMQAVACYFCKQLRFVRIIKQHSVKDRVVKFPMNGSSSAGMRQFHSSPLCNNSETRDINRYHYRVCVEGNIGSGKTTLLDHFLSLPGVEVMQEPVNLWRNVRGYNPLGCMYSDPKRWSMALQTYIQLTMMELHTKPQKEPIRLMERSIHSARYIFVENLHRTGVLPDIEAVILDEWYNWITKEQDVHVDLYVYINTPPEECYERIKKRCRNEEMGIPMELLQQLDSLYEEWFERKRFPVQAPVLVLDGSKDIPSMFEEYKKQEDFIMGRKAMS